MKNILFVGFRGKNNASGLLAEQLSSDHLLLTNSFAGLKKDLDSVSKEYEYIMMFGVDKTLTSSVRIEKVASVASQKLVSVFDLNSLERAMNDAGIPALLSETPTTYLCNEAYWYALDKYSGRAVFIHIPTIKHLDDTFFERMKFAFSNITH